LGETILRRAAFFLVAVLLLSGCGVQIPGGGGGGGGDQPPQITADREAVQQYWDQVRPILENTARDVARVANVDVQLDGGNVSVGIDPNAVEAARQETQQGLDELKAIQPPAGVGGDPREARDRLRGGGARPGNFIAAVQSGDAIQIAQSVRNDLPKIQRLLSEIEAVRQQLQQAGAQ
jgi:hypothetical protein